MTTQQLTAELADLEQQIAHLLEKRDRLTESLAEIKRLSVSLEKNVAELRRLSGGDT